MGGIKGGAAIASRIRQSLLEPSNDPMTQAHQAIQSWFASEWPDVGQDALPGAVATVVDIDLALGKATVYHLGDTRLYRMNNGIVTQVTTDQVDRNGDPNEDFGLSEIHPEIEQFDLQVGDRLVICSDGIYRALGHHDVMGLEVYLQHSTIDQSCAALLQGCQSDFDDNATAWLLEVQGVQQPKYATLVPQAKSVLKWVVLIALVAGVLAGLLLDTIGVLPNDPSPTVLEESNPTAEPPMDESTASDVQGDP
jgi:serine/threonine protein phosphatase PrpC